MEMFVIAVVTIAAFAAVLYPLMRRKPGSTDHREFATDDAPAQRDATMAPMAAGPATPGARLGEEHEPPMSDDDVEREVQRYRTAVRAGTVCRKCGQANPADSLFCFECGSKLPLQDAREFA